MPFIQNASHYQKRTKKKNFLRFHSNNILNTPMRGAGFLLLHYSLTSAAVNKQREIRLFFTHIFPFMIYVVIMTSTKHTTGVMGKMIDWKSKRQRENWWYAKEQRSLVLRARKLSQQNVTHNDAKTTETLTQMSNDIKCNAMPCHAMNNEQRRTSGNSILYLLH